MDKGSEWAERFAELAAYYGWDELDTRFAELDAYYYWNDGRGDGRSYYWLQVMCACDAAALNEVRTNVPQ
jgi:hypothetical protein